MNVIKLAIIAVVAIMGYSIYAITRNYDVPDNHTSQSVESMVDKNSNDYKKYNVLVGEDYDRMLLANMIEHHNGAVDMAKLAQTNAKHQELKDMSEEIISAQSKEIADMESWQKQWGY